MNKKLRKIMFTATLVGLLAASTILAFAKELNSLDIGGPGINGTASFTDPEGMARLMDAGFFDTTSFIKAPGNLGQGYTITAYLNLDGKIVPFVEMVYYPAEAGQSGYMHYTGRLNGDVLETTKVDEWATVTPRAGKAFSELASAHGIALQTAVVAAGAANAAAASPSAPAATPSSGYIALAIGIAVVLAAGLLNRRKAVAERRPPRRTRPPPPPSLRDTSPKYESQRLNVSRTSALGFAVSHRRAAAASGTNGGGGRKGVIYFPGCSHYPGRRYSG